MTTATEQLPAPVWRSAPRGTVHTGLLAHATRGGFTLCGKPVTSFAWRDTPAELVDRCRDCATNPDHARPADFRTLGISYRQLDHWTRRRLVRSVNSGCGPGHHRTWPPSEYAVAARMAGLIRAGYTVQAAARLARDGAP